MRRCSCPGELSMSVKAACMASGFDVAEVVVRDVCADVEDGRSTTGTGVCGRSACVVGVELEVMEGSFERDMVGCGNGGASVVPGVNGSEGAVDPTGEGGISETEKGPR